MTIKLERNQGLVHDTEDGFGLECPHCGVYAHQTPQAVPNVDTLLRNQPKQVGLVYQCDSCRSPVFLRFDVKSYSDSEIDLSPNFDELERPKEKFAFSYLPKHTEIMFREALSCYSNNNFNAFASMCRRAARSAFKEMGDSGKLRAFDEVMVAQDIAQHHRVGLPQLANGEDAAFFQPRLGLAPDAPQAPDGHGVEEGTNAVRRHGNEPGRFLRIRSQLGEELVVRHTDAGLQASTLEDAVTHDPTDGLAVTEQAKTGRDVEKGLVQGQTFDLRRDVVEHFEHLARHLTVPRHSWPDVVCARAESTGTRHGHGGVHTEFTRRVTGGRHHPSRSQTADDHRTVCKARIIVDFHGCIEGIHVHVEDGAVAALDHGWEGLVPAGLPAAL